MPQRQCPVQEAGAGAATMAEAAAAAMVSSGAAPLGINRSADASCKAVTGLAVSFALMASSSRLLSHMLCIWSLASRTLFGSAVYRVPSYAVCASGALLRSQDDV